MVLTIEPITSAPNPCLIMVLHPQCGHCQAAVKGEVQAIAESAHPVPLIVSNAEQSPDIADAFNVTAVPALFRVENGAVFECPDSVDYISFAKAVAPKKS